MFLINNWDRIKKHLHMKNVSYCSIPKRVRTTNFMTIFFGVCQCGKCISNFSLANMLLFFYPSTWDLQNKSPIKKVSLNSKDIRWNHLGKQLSNMKYNDYRFSGNLILGRKLFRFKAMRLGFEIETVLKFKVISICNNS